jgi:thiol peroxidase
MASITLKGNAVNTVGNLPEVGSSAPDFKLVGADLAEKSLADYSGKKKVLNIFPSVDTPTCATSVRSFNEKAASTNNTVVLNISMDLPFAMKRFCAAEGISNVEALSGFRSSFGKDYGLEMADSGLKGLYSRVVIVLSEENQVLHAEQVVEIANEPNYENALKVL